VWRSCPQQRARDRPGHGADAPAHPSGGARGARLPWPPMRRSLVGEASRGPHRAGPRPLKEVIMTTSAGPAFDNDTLRRGIEADNAEVLLSLYADDAELRIVVHTAQPSHPMVLRGREESAALSDEADSRGLMLTLGRYCVHWVYNAY